MLINLVVTSNWYANFTEVYHQPYLASLVSADAVDLITIEVDQERFDHLAKAYELEIGAFATALYREYRADLDEKQYYEQVSYIKKGEANAS